MGERSKVRGIEVEGGLKDDIKGRRVIEGRGMSEIYNNDDSDE